VDAAGRALPLAYALSSEGFQPMQLDERQREEVFLTSAQSVFGLVVIANYRFGVGEALTLFVLFALQLVFTSPEARWFYAIAYLLLATAMIAFKQDTRRAVVDLVVPWR
jgi:cation:H+ antiporter